MRIVETFDKIVETLCGVSVTLLLFGGLRVTMLPLNIRK